MKERSFASLILLLLLSFSRASDLFAATEDHHHYYNSHQALTGITTISPFPIDQSYGSDNHSYTKDGVTIKADPTKISGDKKRVTVTVVVPREALLDNVSRTDYTNRAQIECLFVFLSNVYQWYYMFFLSHRRMHRDNISASETRAVPPRPLRSVCNNVHMLSGCIPRWRCLSSSFSSFLE